MLKNGGMNRMDNNSIKRKLFDILKEFSPDKDFVGGVISNTKNDEDRQNIIDFIQNGDDVTVEKIILLSLYLNQAKYK